MGHCRGPRKATLERCDLGLGPGKLEGAYAQLPRYFEDTGKVQDAESRLVTCMTTLQGLTFDEATANWYKSGSDLEALVTFVAAKSKGRKIDVPARDPHEAEMYAIGEEIFFRRSGPLDFACATCHSQDDKRIRLQELPNLTTAQGAQSSMSQWPAYRVSQSAVWTMERRLIDCMRQMRFPDADYLSDAVIALQMYMQKNASGATLEAPASSAEERPMRTLFHALLLGAHRRVAVAGAVPQDTSAKAEQSLRANPSPARRREEWAARLQQDEVNALCSKYRNHPPPEVSARILELSQRSIELPDEPTRQMMGDWKEGEKLASIGTGGHIGKIQPDRPGTRQGGNCYACHALAAKEVAAGNLGPTLTNYRKVRGNSPQAVQYVYSKIYNAQAFFPCSSMPRFGYNKWLTPKEIADITAFLLDPESPVNK